MDDFQKYEDNTESYFPEGTVHQEETRMMGNFDFVWDAAKNRHNIQVHHVDFETAMFVFNDMDRIEIYDESHSEEEERWDTIGRPTGSLEAGEQKGVGPKLTLGKVHDLLYVVYTDRIIMGREMIRLISARRATRFEEMLYRNGT